MQLKFFTKPENLWLAIIIAAGAALRFYHYGSFSYSNDELSALNRLYYDSFAELVRKGFYVDGHPGGIQVFMWKWVSWFGDTEWSVRLPFVVFGVLSVWFTYLSARYMFGIAAGLFSAAAISFLQFPLLYSQIARPYGPGMLFSLMLVYFWLNIFFDESGNLKTGKPKLKHLAGFAISAALCMYTHYFSFLFALIVGFSGFIFARRNNVFQFIGAALIAAMLFIPHIGITLNHLTYKGLGLWLGAPSKGWIFDHLFYIFDNSLYILILFLLTLLSLLFINKEIKPLIKYRGVLAFWFLAPIVIGYFYSVNVSPVLQHPVLIFSFPYFIILIFSYAGDLLTKAKKILLPVFLAAGIAGTVFINNYYQQQHFGEFKDIARLTAKWQHEFGDENITKVISINNPLYIDHYLMRLNARVRFDLYDVKGTDGLQTLSEILKNSDKPYFLYAVTKPSPAEAEDIIRSFYPYIIHLQDYGQFSSVTLYCKEKGENYENFKNLKEIRFIKADLKSDTLISVNKNDTLKCHKLDETSEYSPGIELKLDDLNKKDNLSISAEIELFVPENSGESVLVISIETPDGKSIQWEGANSKFVEKAGYWVHLINTLHIDSELPTDAKMKVYFWNKDKKAIFIRNLQCRVFE